MEVEATRSGSGPGPERELELLLERGWKAIGGPLYWRWLRELDELGISRAELAAMVESAVMYAAAEFWVDSSRWKPSLGGLVQWLRMRARDAFRKELRLVVRTTRPERNAAVRAELRVAGRSEPDPAEEVVRHLWLEEGLARLPAEDDRALRLYHYDGCSIEEVAREMGCTVHKVESLLIRARKVLKRHLEGQPLPKRGRPRKGDRDHV